MGFGKLSYKALQRLRSLGQSGIAWPFVFACYRKTHDGERTVFTGAPYVVEFSEAEFAMKE